MPPKPKTGSVSEDEEQCSTRLFACTGKGPNGNQCPAWVPTWIPKRVPRSLMERPFLCRFCAATEWQDSRLYFPNQSKKAPNSSHYSTHTPTSCLGGEITSVSSVWKRPTDEDPYQKVVEVAQQVGLEILKSDSSVCHRVPSRTSKRPLIVNFVRQHTNFELMTRKKKLREPNSPHYINEDLSLLGAKLAAKLPTKGDLKAVS